MNPWVEHVRAFAKRRGVSYMCASSMPDCREEYQARKGAVERSVKGKSKIDTAKQSKKLFKELNLERTKRAMKTPPAPAPAPKTVRAGKTVTVAKSKLKPAPAITPIGTTSQI